MSLPVRMSMFLLFTSISMIACSTSKPINSITPIITESNDSLVSCPVTEPSWILPPEDSAVLNPPAYGYYYVNKDRSILASAYWPREKYPLRAGKQGNKVGWFRPEGAAMEITGRRLDGQAPLLEVELPCCYPTHFQPSGLYFPTEGCWEVTVKAAGSTLSFVVWVEP